MILCGCEKVDKQVESTEEISIEYPEGFGQTTEEKPIKEIEELNNTASTEEQPTTEIYNPREDILIALDPGHQAPSIDMSTTEPNAPGSSVMKARATSGTSGKYTGVGEYELNLNIAKKVRDSLSDLGYNVIMTREDNETAISNMERAQLANEKHANISVRIHANGSDDSSANGALILIGSQSNPYVGYLYDESYRLGEYILNSYCDYTGMKNLGIQTNDIMTGINWSEIPVIILEMGFMSNESDDRNMQDISYQEKMVEGIVAGIEKYYCFDSEKDNNTNVNKSNDLQAIVDSEVATFPETNGFVSVYIEDMATGMTAEHGNTSMIAASLIKLYIAGCIYELQDTNPQDAPQNVDDLIGKMLSESDNNAANALVKKLGGGDVTIGMQKINTYCSEHGLTDSSMGRLMLDFNANSENFTSVKDSAAFLKSVYNENLCGSDKIMSYLKQQKRTNKIPSGIPEGIETANKTGELENVENDVAIIFANNHPYVISVMTGDVQDKSIARDWIVDFSQKVYEYITK